MIPTSYAIFSCETAINDIVHEWKIAMDGKKSILAVFLDLQKAFETIDPFILLKKLDKLGFEDSTLNWFKNYLTGRTQMVKIDNYMSKKMKVKLGVPQGSILGPLLFNLYINDLERSSNLVKMKMFADDTLIYIITDDINQATEIMNKEIKKVYEELCRHKLLVNVKKTKAMVVSKNQNHSNPVRIFLNDEPIEIVTQMKYLGIIIDDKLKFDKNIDYLCSKISKKNYVIGRLRNELCLSQKLLLYKTIIQPHFIYCATVLFLANKCDISRLQKLQNKCLRHILKLSKYTSKEVLLNSICNECGPINKVLHDDIHPQNCYR